MDKEREFRKRIFFASKHSDRNKKSIINKAIEQKNQFGLDFVLNNVSIEARKLYSLSCQVSMYIHKAESFIRLKQFKETLIGKAVFDFPVAENIAGHFIKRFPNKKIIVIDEKTRYAFVSEGNEIKMLPAEEFLELFDSIKETFDDKELNQLFGVFYDSQVIEERKNRTYALRMMPKKYWKNFNLKESRKIERGIQKNTLLNYV